MVNLRQIFTARQVLMITGVPYSQLISWIRSGVIRPSVSVAQGSGSRCLYSRDDLFTIRAAWELRKKGLSGRALRAALDYISENLVGFTTIERAGNDVVVTSGQESVSVLNKPGQMCLDFTLDVENAVAYVGERLEGQSPSGRKPVTRQGSSGRRSRRNVS